MELRIAGVEVKKVEDNPKRLNLLLWGQAGVGKTLFASTAPGKKLWLSFDPNGLDTLNFSPEKDNIQTVDLSKSNYAIVRQGCNENCFGIEAYLKDNLFDTVVFDSATTYLDLCLRLGIEGIKNATIELPSMAGYAKKNSYFKQTMINLIKLTNKYNKHLVIIGHEDNGKMDDLGNIIEQGPMIGGSNGTSIAIMLSEIWYLGMFNGKRKVMFAPYSVKKLMKTRMIDLDKCKQIEWNYTLENGGHGLNTWYNQWVNSSSKIIPE